MIPKLVVWDNGYSPNCLHFPKYSFQVQWTFSKCFEKFIVFNISFGSICFSLFQVHLKEQTQDKNQPNCEEKTPLSWKQLLYTQDGASKPATVRFRFRRPCWTILFPDRYAKINKIKIKIVIIYLYIRWNVSTCFHMWRPCWNKSSFETNVIGNNSEVTSANTVFLY